MLKSIIGLCTPASNSKKQKQLEQPEEVVSKSGFYHELEIDVLARTIFGEARGEPLEGLEAVASVVLNRVRVAEDRGGSYWWGKNIIGVCQKPYQFSCWNKNDPSYKRLTSVTAKNIHFATCMRIARRAVIGALQDNTGGATHYHADYVSPYWAKGEKPTRAIGRHIFYQLVRLRK